MEHKPLFGETVRLEVEFVKAKAWAVTKAHVPQKCLPDLVDKCIQGRNAFIKVEQQRAYVQKVLLDACAECSLTSGALAFSVHPSNVWTEKKVSKKGGLKLFPCGTVSKLKGAPVQDKVYIKAFDSQWLVTPFKALSDFSKEDGLLAPYWWVKVGNEEDECNMVHAEVTLEQCKIPVLINAGSVAAHEKLVVQGSTSVKKAKKGTE